MKLGSRIKQLRKERGLTQEQLADAVKVHWRTISNLERDKTHPKSDLLARLARLFGTTIDNLLNGNH